MPKRGKSIRSSSRNEETKPSKSTAKTTDRFISISFKHFHNVDDVGQSINTWKDDGSLPDLIEKLVYLRIPLYSITDWHRSPISDSHPFDQPGT